MPALPTRKIGKDDVSALGLGTMGLSAYYVSSDKVPSDEERFKVFDAAYERGCTFWDTADVYGDSEDLIGKWHVHPSLSPFRPILMFKKSGKRDEIFIATKFGLASPNGKFPDGDPEYVPKAIDSSLKRLGVDRIDLYYLHRPDPTVPIELTVGAMADGVKAGKIKYLGLSECSEKTLRRAHAVHPISALQVEYSPFTLDIEDEKFGLLKTARELGIAIIAYSPLGRGLLTGQIRSRSDLEEGDFRLSIPRYSDENFPNILKLADGLKAIGEHHNATAGQVALAWVLAQGNDIIPIPGTTKIKYLDENLSALKVKLTTEELKEVRTLAAASATLGDRYPDDFMKVTLGDTPELK